MKTAILQFLVIFLCLSFTITGCSKVEDDNLPIDIISWIKPVKFRKETTRPENLTKKSDDGFLISGYISYSNTNLTHGFVINMDSNGDTIWCKQIDVGDFTQNNVTYAVQKTEDIIIITGVCYYPRLEQSKFIIWLDSNGNLIRQIVFPSITGYNIYGCKVILREDGYIYLAYSLMQMDESNNVNYSFRIDLLNEAGEIIRNRLYQNVYMTQLSLLENNNLLVTGRSNAGGSPFNNKMLFLLIDETGNEINRKLFGTDSWNQANSVCTDYGGGYLVSGIITYENLSVIYPVSSSGEVGNYTTNSDTIYSFGNILKKTDDSEYFLLNQSKYRLYFMKLGEDLHVKWTAWFDNPYAKDLYPISVSDLIRLSDGAFAFLYWSDTDGRILVKTTPVK
jgi:hypothetical protein